MDTPTPTKSPLNLGTFVFGGLSLLTLAISFAKGIVPIYLAEAALWAALALFWHKKHVTSPAANGLVLLCAIALAAGEGFLIGRQGHDRFRYLQQGSTQFRVNERLGSTDRLTGSGWQPVSFDRPAEAVPLAGTSDDHVFGGLAQLSLTNGVWTGNSTNAGLGEICYGVENKSDYVLRDVTVNVDYEPVSTLPKSELKSLDLRPISLLYPVVLRTGSGLLLGPNATSRLCGPSPPELPEGSKWSSKLVSAAGWKVK